MTGYYKIFSNKRGMATSPTTSKTKAELEKKAKEQVKKQAEDQAKEQAKSKAKESGSSLIDKAQGMFSNIQKALGGGTMGMLGILGIIFAVVGMCSSGEEAVPQETPQPEIQEKTTLSCGNLGGKICKYPPGCLDNSNVINSNEMESSAGIVCCKDNCADASSSKALGFGEITYVNGDDSLSCAAQGQMCGLDEFCEGNNWVKSIDSQRCCKDESDCLARIFASDVVLEGIQGGSVTVEKIAQGSYLVWWGQSSATTEFDEAIAFPAIGRPNSSPCSKDCTFEAKNTEGKTQTYSITIQETDKEIIVKV